MVFLGMHFSTRSSAVQQDRKLPWSPKCKKNKYLLGAGWTYPPININTLATFSKCKNSTTGGSLKEWFWFFHFLLQVQLLVAFIKYWMSHLKKTVKPFIKQAVGAEMCLGGALTFFFSLFSTKLAIVNSRHCTKSGFFRFEICHANWQIILLINLFGLTIFKGYPTSAIWEWAPSDGSSKLLTFSFLVCFFQPCLEVYRAEPSRAELNSRS